ncbi:MAG: restriction endonuclease [Dysgonamonadaceae bacterium]|jgi:DNA modification methylase|nr:restriction endonuclease [Dysgonamonadaceae bacterium]
MDNQLYYGDNLEILQDNIPDGSVDLCYIDPPFNSNRDYNQIYNNIGKDVAQATAFTDTWEWDRAAVEGLKRFDLVKGDKKIPLKTKHLIAGLFKVLERGSMMAYIISITQRIIEIYRVLKPTGSFYLHCDPTASHYLKLILDSVFCENGGDFKNEIVWRRHYSHNDGKKFGCIHDIILFYTKSKNYTYNRQHYAYTNEYALKKYNGIDEKTLRRFRSVSMNAPGQGDAKYFGDKLLEPPKGTHWRWSQDRINESIENGIIYFTKNGVPRYKQFLDEMEGVPVQDTWTEFYGLSSHDKERLGYPTQKPEALMEIIINASSNIGDVVLDAYCGCGTTVAVAQRLKRKWIGIDITYQSIYVILKRLEEHFGKKIINHIEISGIPRDIESAKALAHKKEDKTRKEFEKWAVITYSNNEGTPNEKKGADKGIDGVLNIYWNADAEAKEVLFSVKSGHVSVAQIRDFLHVIDRENAAAGVFITLEEPTKPMILEAKSAGTVTIPLTGQSVEKLQIVSIQEILDGKRANFPLTINPLKKAERKIEDNQSKIVF